MDSLTQIEAARRGVMSPEMHRVAERERVTADFIREEVARGRLVIPANKRHLAGSGGEKPAIGQNPGGATGAGPPAAGHWVNRTVAQREADLASIDTLRGERAAKRLDPMGIGRMITT